MYACVSCGVRLPSRSRGGHIEREYCSDRCRQRAYRKQKKQDLETRQLIERVCGRESLFPDPYDRHDHWRFERAGLLQSTKLLASQCDVAESEATYLKHRNQMLEEELCTLKNVLAEKEAEIVYLSVLLDSQAKKHRPK